MEPETGSLRLRYRRTRSITSLFGIQAAVLKISSMGSAASPRTVTSQEQNVTSERNWNQEADPNLTRVDPYYSSLTLTSSRLLPIQLIDKARVLNLVDEAQIPIVFLR